MTRIAILGAGVMGSALAVPPASVKGNTVTLIGSPLDDDIVASVRSTRHHPTLNVDLPEAIRVVRNDELDQATLRAADIIVIGVSSPGIPWVCERMRDASATPGILSLVTKGLVARDDGLSPPATYADALPASLCATPNGIVGIGGPCIARELALGYPTRVTFASAQLASAAHMRARFQTDDYRVTVERDIVGVEACAALKNFLCIGVSAMLGAHPLADGFARNPLAALFNQAVRELAILADWLGETSPLAAESRRDAMHLPAFDLAGLGDLHVTVGGGRNSRLGRHLGTGATLSDVLDGPMKDVTVEGVDTGRALEGGLQAAIGSGRLSRAALPLTLAILDVIERGRPFEFDFRDLPG